MSEYEYRVTHPELQNTRSPVMDSRDMEAWLNHMGSHGWELVSYGATQWVDRDDQEWWVFRRKKEV